MSPATVSAQPLGWVRCASVAASRLASSRSSASSVDWRSACQNASSSGPASPLKR
jgi:hypothetical protein